MKKLLYIIIAVGLLVITIVWLKRNKEISEKRIYHYDKAQPIIVAADTVASRPINFEQSYTGNFEPDKETKISAEVQGKIQQYFVEAGTVVKKGSPLVKLDNELLQLQLRSVEVQIEGLQSDVKRYTVLVNSNAIQGVQLEKAELGLKSALVQQSTVKEQISKTLIRAPFNGIVTMKLSEVGAFAAPGIPLVQLTDINQLRFTINVPEQDLPLFESRPEFTITADQYPGEKLSGKIVLIGSKGSGANLYPVQFLVKNTPQLKIRAGMFGKITLMNSLETEGILIPSSAIIGSDVQPQVYVVQSGKAVLKSIEVSRRIGNQAMVTNGLKPGDIIVSGGFINLADGAPVQIK